MVVTKGYNPLKNNGIYFFMYFFNAGKKKFTKSILVICIALGEEYSLWNM